MLKKLSAVLGAVVMAGAATVMAAPQASALAASPTALCGSGYSVVDSEKLINREVWTYLLYNSSNGYNCVVTIRGEAGSPVKMAARLQVQGSAEKNDTGSYTKYAGPVYAYGAGKCVRWGGWFSESDQSSYFSDWDHCG
ncbi:acetyltransferase [Kitasatospora sp. DSM 101779]|uniref:acetyltransferase n=1 Tax=Kitasatospora sp. DSM 101779 TaxID=2853165 RepID=UPI0021D9CAE6|nr:acetyltransferase [Kitasatospora sp. DSM 101779]MCU7820448.1 acetyltransferase [Kitasatospora sp. DSM 101779]